MTVVGLIGTTHEGMVDKAIAGEISGLDAFNYIRDDLFQKERRIMTESFINEYGDIIGPDSEKNDPLENIVKLKQHHNCPFETF